MKYTHIHTQLSSVEKSSLLSPLWILILFSNLLIQKKPSRAQQICIVFIIIICCLNFFFEFGNQIQVSLKGIFLGNHRSMKVNVPLTITGISYQNAKKI